MDISIDAEVSSSFMQSFQDRYILTQVGQRQLVFPSQWVSEILLIERSHILPLPFYGSIFLGVIHHQNHIVPLISSQGLLSEKSNRSVRFTDMERLNVICLSQATERFTGVGIVVEEVVGNCSEEQLTAQETMIERFRLQDIPNHVWQPQR
jgi:chemotaxis signal transduction protein